MEKMRKIKRDVAEAEVPVPFIALGRRQPPWHTTDQTALQGSLIKSYRGVDTEDFFLKRTCDPAEFKPPLSASRFVVGGVEDHL